MDLSTGFALYEDVWKKIIQTMGKDGGYLLLGRIIQMGNGFAISVYLVKKFGLEAVGTYTVASVCTSIVAFMSACGLNYSLPREKFTAPERNSISVIILSLTFVIALIIIVGFSSIMGRDNQEAENIAIFSAMGYLFAQTNIINTLLLLDKRMQFSLLAPIFNSIGIVLGIINAQSLFQFGLFVVASRFLGNILNLAGLQYKKVKWSLVLRQTKAGAKFLPMDLMSHFSEQLISLILAIILPRAELGIFGLCRQVLYTAITPGWSQIDANYPRLVSSGLKNAHALKSQNKNLSHLATLLTILGSFILGIFIYKIPEFWFMCVFLALTIPARYLGYFYDKILRSLGEVRKCNYLTFSRIVISIVIFPIFVSMFQLWGAITGWVILSLVSLFLWEKAAQPLIPQRPITDIV